MYIYVVSSDVIHYYMKITDVIKYDVTIPQNVHFPVSPFRIHLVVEDICHALDRYFALRFSIRYSNV
jgi:hypothetical protein